MDIVTIHANGTSAYLMKGIELATMHISLPGHDGVPLKSEYSLANLSDFVVSELKGMEVVLIGNSIGGMLAHQVADRVNVRAIISIGMPPLNYDVLEGALLENEYVQLANTELLTEGQMQKLSEGMCSSKTSVEKIFSAIKSADPRVRSGLMTSLQNGDLRDEHLILRDLDIPILFIRCVDDLIVNNKKFDDLAFGEVIDISGTHIPTLDQEERLNEIIKDFLSRNKIL